MRAPRRQRRRSLTLLVLVVALAIPVLPARAEVHTVFIGDDYYEPPHITIRAGDTIVWENEGSYNHTVTDADGHWDSGPIAPGSSYDESETFLTPGPYDYYCTIHEPGMAGTILVEEGGRPDEPPPDQPSDRPSDEPSEQPASEEPTTAGSPVDEPPSEGPETAASPDDPSEAPATTAPTTPRPGRPRSESGADDGPGGRGEDRPGRGNGRGGDGRAAGRSADGTGDRAVPAAAAAMLLTTTAFGHGWARRNRVS